MQPDLCVICDAKKLDERGCLGAPDLIVEIISQGTQKKDIEIKKNAL
ncbi:Uma2 family endonuclease [Thermoflexibacter ruber]|nr:Uma2 family endonuclease [Thermoflexibacter ruber]